MQILKGHAGGKPIYDLDFSPDGTKLASSSQDRTIRLWDLSTGQSQIVGEGDSWDVQFHPTDSNRLLADGSILNIDSESWMRLQPDAFGTIVFSHDGKTVIAAEGNLLHFHDAKTGKRRKSATLVGTRFVVSDASPDGRFIAVSGWVEGAGRKNNKYPAVVLAYPSGREVARLNDASNYVSSLTFSADGQFLAGTSSTFLRVWEIESHRLVLTDQPDKKQHFHGVAFSPDGRSLAAGHHDCSVRMYSTADWSVRETRDWGIGPIVTVTFAPDGLRAAAGSKKGKIVIWDLET